MEPDLESRLTNIEARLARGDYKFDCLDKKVDEIKVIIDQGKSFFMFLGHIGSIIKWFVGVGLSILGLWAAFRNLF